MFLVVPELYGADRASNRNGEGLDNPRQMSAPNLLNQRVVALLVRLECINSCRWTRHFRKQACRITDVRSNVENVAVAKELWPVFDQIPVRIFIQPFVEKVQGDERPAEPTKLQDSRGPYEIIGSS